MFRWKKKTSQMIILDKRESFSKPSPVAEILLKV